MLACMHACIHTYIHLYTYLFLHIHTHTRIYIYIHRVCVWIDNIHKLLFWESLMRDFPHFDRSQSTVLTEGVTRQGSQELGLPWDGNIGISFWWANMAVSNVIQMNVDPLIHGFQISYLDVRPSQQVTNKHITAQLLCIYIYMNVWMYECMNVWMYEWMNECMYVCMYV